MDTKATGFKSWGYFYETQYTSGELASNQGNWDILKLDYGASAANIELSYGSQGLMYSGAMSILPTGPYSNN